MQVGGKGETMRHNVLKRAGMLATVAIAVTTLGVPAAQAQAVRLSWQPTLLPLPAGASPLGHGFLTASDGHGEYTGSFIVDNKLQVVSWRGGKPVLRGLPEGYEWAMVQGEDSAGRVYGNSIDYDTSSNRSFVLDAAGFHLRDNPAGYREFQVQAVNRRGDAVGSVFTDDPADNAVAVWPADAAAPTLVPLPAGADGATDIDDDGAILFNGFERDIVWKNGVSRPLADLPGFSNPHGSAIRNGVVVGFASNGNASQAVRWATPEKATALSGGDYAIDLNVGGLTAGLTPPAPGSFRGKPTVWRSTSPGGELKQPGTYAAYQPFHVSDDGTFAGSASNGPLDEGGVPVIWRLAP
jgi:hypothetical protein